MVTGIKITKIKVMPLKVDPSIFNLSRSHLDSPLGRAVLAGGASGRDPLARDLAIMSNSPSRYC
jgi:hypothetical protein